MLWTPIDKALRLTFPTSNNNYFGIDEKVKVALTESLEEQPVIALLSTLSEIKESMAAIPKFKLEKKNGQ